MENNWGNKMSYNCDGCGKTAKLVSTQKGTHLCQSCYKKVGLEKVGRCHNCDTYFQASNSPDGGVTCSDICSKQYVAYLHQPEVD